MEDDDNNPNTKLPFIDEHIQTQITYSRKRKQQTTPPSPSDHHHHHHHSTSITNPIIIIPQSSVLTLVLFTYDIRHLPDSLLLEIISRLPLKSIFKFKCVSKHWLTLISQPSFPRFYFSRIMVSRFSNYYQPFRILYRYIYVSKFKDVLDRFRPEIYDSDKFSVLFMSSFEEQQQSDQFKVLGMSNGLVLCCLLGPLIYYVCDPVTRQWVTLPRGRDMSAGDHPIFFGEGFVSKVDEDNVVVSFTVVRVQLLSLRTNYLSLEAFSSETGKWVDYKLPCAHPIALMKRGGGPISFNGIFHWFVYDHGMVAFNPDKEPKSCRLIQFPEDREVESEYKYDGLYRLCDECQGKLRFFEVARDSCSFYCFSMWAMKDYEKGEWCSEFKVTRSDLSSSDPELDSWLFKATFFPLSFHPFDLDIVYLRCVELSCVVSYSIQNKRLDVASRPIGVVDDLSWRVVIPFVIPRWPTPVPIPPVPKKVVKPKAAHRLRSFKINTRFY